MFGLIYTPKKSLKDRLNEAKLLIEKSGWCQNLFSFMDEKENLNYCVLGAMFTSEQDNLIVKSMMERFCKANNIDHSGELYSTISRWNDCPRRTKDDVLKAFDKAITYAGGK